ncbi:MAG: hypothetical protein ACHRHE_04580 [Tepidisphaerales bacterium]
MLSHLAYADANDPSQSNLVLVLLGIGVILVASVLAVVPVVVAWSRRHKRSDVVVPLAVLWGLVVAGSVISTLAAEMQWSREQVLRMKTGYYDSEDRTGAPTRPWGLWAGLGAAYGGLLAGSMAGGNRRSKGAAA